LIKDVVPEFSGHQLDGQVSGLPAKMSR
jgi:hypothetical protein